MKKLGVFAGVISILCLGILGCNEESSNPIRV